MLHAGDLFDGSLLLQDVGAELWEVERKAGPKLTVMWGTDLDDFDPETQVWPSISLCLHQQGHGFELWVGALPEQLLAHDAGPKLRTLARQLQPSCCPVCLEGLQSTCCDACQCTRTMTAATTEWRGCRRPHYALLLATKALIKPLPFRKCCCNTLYLPQASDQQSPCGFQNLIPWCLCLLSVCRYCTALSAYMKKTTLMSSWISVCWSKLCPTGSLPHRKLTCWACWLGWR